MVTYIANLVAGSDVNKYIQQTSIALLVPSTDIQRFSISSQSLVATLVANSSSGSYITSLTPAPSPIINSNLITMRRSLPRPSSGQLWPRILN